MRQDSISSSDPLVSLFLELAGIPSPSGHERAVNDFLTTRLRGLGLEVEEGEPLYPDSGSSAGNLYCRLEASVPGTPILLSAHTDTVPSEEEALPEPVVVDGVIRSASRTVLGADDKSAVAAIVFTLEKIIRSGFPQAGIELLLTVGEEGGLNGAKMSSMDGVAAECGFCLDSTGPVGDVIVRSPSQKTINATFIGVSAHAGVVPEEGRSAVRAASRAIASMKLGRIDDETTANVGIIRGGEAVNVVPDRCTFHSEARSHTREKLESQVAHMIDAIQLAAAEEEVDVELTVVDEFHGFDFSEGGLPIELAERAFSRMGLATKRASTGGGSDVNVFNLKGLPCVNLATGMEKVHTPDEYISVESLHQMHEFLLALVDEARGASADDGALTDGGAPFDASAPPGESTTGADEQLSFE
ncbi:MAG: M20/M25/M40 family metallo-hydrolase [Actinobacteria bacterium]|nr:M20/M25/M40 family metallo-hydrolase [Actinomycetota bacterium]